MGDDLNFMNEEPKAVKKGLWKRLWDDPLYFCCVWMLASIVGLVAGHLVLSNPNNSYLNHHLHRTEAVITIVLILGVVFGLLGTLLSFIDPVRRLLARLLARRFFWLACVLTLIALVYAEEDWRGWYALRQYEHQWEAKGAKFDFMQVIPPAVPDDQNFALTPIVASSYAMMMDQSGHELNPRDTNVINRLSMVDYGNEKYGYMDEKGNWMGGKVTDLKAWQKFYRDMATKTNQYAVPAQPGSPAADVLFTLGKFDSTIEELRQASRLPASRFPLTYDRDEPAEILLPHLAAMKAATRTLELRVIAELQNGQTNAALADIKLMFYLVGATRTEPFLISQLVRLAQLDLALQPVYEGLAAHQWSDAQLADLDTELSQLDFVADFKSAMRGEMAMSIRELEYMRRTRSFQALDYDVDGSHQQSPAFDMGLELMPAGFFYQSERQMARMQLEYVLPIVDTDKGIISPDVVRQNGMAATNDLTARGLFGVMARMTMPALINSTEKFAKGQAHVDLARVAIALERYRLANGAYPATLDSLVPNFMADPPHDIINGQPLRYRTTSDGQFVLYSVGWNETDDGGVVVHHEEKGRETGAINDREGDWVWKYPAK